VQRLLAAKANPTGRHALLASAPSACPIHRVSAIGVFLYVFAKHSPLLHRRRTDRILPLFLVREMPVGLAGLLLASIVAVAMSNASGSLNSLAASSVLDFATAWAKRRPRPLGALSPRHDARVGPGADGFGLVKWGPLPRNRADRASLPFGSLLGLFLLGTFDRGANARGALAGMIVGDSPAILCLFQLRAWRIPGIS